MERNDPIKNAGVISGSGYEFEYQFRTMSVSHFTQLQEDIERVRRDGQMSDHKVFQSYLSGFEFALPKNFSNAQSVIILAVFIKPLMVNFEFNGNRIPAAMPSNYYDPGFTRKMLQDEIQNNIIREDGYRVERIDNLFHLKLLAVRSGLGRYGRNNICYVDGMGSFLTLHAYLTDYVFEADNWQEIQMMDLCQNCTICMRNCPGGAIRAEPFVINIKRCIPLYNEIEGELPDWIPANAHNAFMGCMKCQFPCPANREAIKRMEPPVDITAEETRQFVNGNPDENVILSVSQKLKISYLVGSKEMVEIASRNIKALVNVS